ncbi:carbohydrate-binding module family 32 [Lophiostoma macrostomum CBS 122681]|uniref:Carbohydrate-binding module family 32 n=1 Tax=Lophiostoma macrostomum CBS 122681 TaxID=1314788 RepID=A0A6A6SYA9_9PLEO|nr:carbohydrate-binding module family 32 [Lophiostoma macrostomum CBS 122681]
MSFLHSFLTTLLLYFTLLQPVYSAPHILLDRTGWTATADSSDDASPPSNVLDGSSSTFWQTYSDPDPEPLPHVLIIDMQTPNLIGRISMQPRQDGSSSGNIGQHSIEVSSDGSAWTQVALGTWNNDDETKNSTFVPRPGRYIRITATSAADSTTDTLTAIAEVNVYAAVNYLSRSSWTVSASSQETGGSGSQATKAIDGPLTTIWQAAYRSGTTPFPHWFQIDQGAPVAVQGLSYVPRLDGATGRIGQFEITVSNDTETWVSVATGTWADDDTEKLPQFIATARYVLLTAYSEAGNRGDYTSAAEINLLDPSIPAYTPPDPTKGIWDHTVDLPLVAPAGAVLPNGKVLLWSSYARDEFGGSTGVTQTAIYDPVTGVSTQRTVTNTQHDMFCPGISMDFEGRIIVTGGDNAQKTSIYIASTDTWIPGLNMRIGRGYQATATVSDGRIFNIGGSWSGGRGGKNGEIYDPLKNSWTLQPNNLVAPMLTNDAGGVFRADNHGWFFAWKKGFVLQAGPSLNMNWYNTSGDGGGTPAGTRSTDLDAMNGNAVMYDAVAGKILTAGGAQSYGGDTSRTSAFVITIPATSGSMPTVTPTQNMTYARGFGTGIALPDGTVFVTGGQLHVEPFTDISAAFTPELWDPTTGTWTQMNPMANPRTYHSIGLLLPDATVLNAAGGLCGPGCVNNHWDGEIFVPPYLLNADGSRRSRPSILTIAVKTRTGVGDATDSLAGGQLGISTDRNISSFALIRLGSSTHTVNTDQRRIPVPAYGNPALYSVVIPSDPGVALPGYWYIFAIDEAGTPSAAKIVKITPCYMSDGNPCSDDYPSATSNIVTGACQTRP